MNRSGEMNRRTYLRRATVPVALAIAGCAAPRSGPDESDEPNERGDGGNGDTDSPGAVDGTAPIPRIEDPPAAVYLPGHRKSMRVLEPVRAGDYALAPMLSYPHPFWVVTGDDREAVEPEAGRGVHLMVVCWDPETGAVLAGDAEPTVAIARNDELIASRSLWPMLSQEMGLHFGDNITLPSDGTYTVRVDLPPLSTRRTGSLADRFAEGGTATFEFTYDRAFREDVVDGLELLDRERWGKRGALEPMDHGEGEHTASAVPYSALPPTTEYPGTHLVDPAATSGDDSGDDLPRSGDAAFVVTVLESDARLAPGNGTGDGRYLLVSPRSPYNRVPLPNMSMRAVLERNGDPVDGPFALEQSIDAEFGLSYGRSVADIRAADSVRIAIESPPQAVRHQGYETAFFEMDPLELVVPEAESARTPTRNANVDTLSSGTLGQ